MLVLVPCFSRRWCLKLVSWFRSQKRKLRVWSNWPRKFTNKQACVRIQELVNVAESLYQLGRNQASSLQRLTQEIQATKMKLQEQIHQNQMLTQQMEHHKFQLSDQVHQNRVLFGQRDGIREVPAGSRTFLIIKLLKSPGSCLKLQSANALLESLAFEAI